MEPENFASLPRKDKPLVSVIVPVYNVEPWLRRCVDSILRQDYTDFELLLIDDGSTDHSGAICDEYAHQNERIFAYHKENGGLSDARNFGIDRARGDFISFVDSDDYVGPDYLRILVETQDQFQADAVILKMVSTHAENVKLTASSDQRAVLQPKDAVRKVVCNSIAGVSACGKLYRRHLFASRRFPVGMLYEDLHTIPYLLGDCQLCAYSTSVQYYYYMRTGSITHTISDRAIEMWNGGIEQLYGYFEQKDPEAVDCVVCRYVSFGFNNIINNLSCSKDYTHKAKLFRDRHLNWWKKGLKNPYLTKKEKLKAFLFLINVDLYRWFHRQYVTIKPLLTKSAPVI